MFLSILTSSITPRMISVVQVINPSVRFYIQLVNKETFATWGQFLMVQERKRKVRVVFAVAFPQVRRSAALWSSGGQLITLKVNIVLFRTHYRSTVPVSINFECKKIFLMLRFTGLAESMHLDIQEKKNWKAKMSCLKINFLALFNNT